MKNISIIILSLILSACITKSPHILNSYDLDINIPNSSGYKNSKILEIEYPKALGAISSSRIYYKRGDTTNYYLYSRWSSSLNSMLYKDILKSMQNSKYKNVIGYDSSANANLKLETQIIDFYHIVQKNNSYAQITISVKLIGSNNKIIKSKIFRYKKEVATPNAHNFALSAKETLKEFLEELRNF